MYQYQEAEITAMQTNNLFPPLESLQMPVWDVGATITPEAFSMPLQVSPEIQTGGVNPDSYIPNRSPSPGDNNAIDSDYSTGNEASDEGSDDDSDYVD